MWQPNDHLLRLFAKQQKKTSETLTFGSEKYASEIFFEITATTVESIHWVYRIYSVHARQKTDKILDKQSGIRGVQNTVFRANESEENMAPCTAQHHTARTHKSSPSLSCSVFCGRLSYIEHNASCVRYLPSMK